MNAVYNLPNLLTLSRIALIPVFVILFYLPVSWGTQAATLVFMLAAFTDWLDGFIARLSERFLPRSELDLPGPGAAVLTMDVKIGLGNGVGIEPGVVV